MNELNPFKPSQEISINAASNSDIERSIQEVQASLVIAKKFPRDNIHCMENILNACTRPSLALTALYSYKRGKTEVTGPSIRLAETIAQHWGNLQFGIRELSSEKGVSTVEAFAWDIQSNTKQIKTFQVPHVRYTREHGKKKLEDPRDIYEAIANQGARRLRACILGVIPGDVTEAAVQACLETQNNNMEITPELLKQWVDAFEGIGVNQGALEKKFGKRIESFNAPQIVNLSKIFNSIKDQMSDASDWFDVESIKNKKESIVSKITKKNEESKNEVDSKKQEKEPEVKPTYSPGFIQLEKKLQTCKTEESARDLLELSIFNKMKASERQEFCDLVNDHLAKLEL